jgi:sulfatase modifying factor 1
VRIPPLAASLLALLATSVASAVTMAWTPIGNPGNPADTQVMNDRTTGYGSVPYSYSIGTYEVTNAQYVAFLNAKAKTDPLGLYNPEMSIPEGGTLYGGITRSGSSGSYTYSAISGRGDMPVNYVSFYDALRFANWMNNGQGSADTETGAYTLLGGTAWPSNGGTVTRNAAATIVLPSENEWYKAAYYDRLSGSYFDYPANSDAQSVCQGPDLDPSRANCNLAVGNLTIVGSYKGSASAYGTYDQGGNVYEWNESIVNITSRGFRGGSFGDIPGNLAASHRSGAFPGGDDNPAMGFRLAMIPEPNTGLLVIAGLLGLGGRRRNSA